MPERTQPDQRNNPRRRTRLRSGKIARRNGVFLTECLIFDRSPEGAQLRLEAAGAIPDRFLIFDDELNSLTPASVVWRSQSELGIRFDGEASIAGGKEIARGLSGKYYALRTG
jgi:hypothetical protein